MRRLQAVIIAALVIVGSTSCIKEQKGNVTIVFKGTYGDDPPVPLVMLEKHGYAFDEEIQFTKSDFYLSHVRIASGSGITAELVEIELVDLSFTNEADAIAGYEISVNDIAAAPYNRFDFAIGVDSEMNATMPEDWPASHPLSEPRYWDSSSSYIFAKTEGNLDTLGNGSADLEWKYHTGTDEIYILLSATLQLNVQNGGTTRIVFTVDHKKLFGVGDDPIDIKQKPIIGSPQDSLEMSRLVENYSKAITFVIE